MTESESDIVASVSDLTINLTRLSESEIAVDSLNDFEICFTIVHSFAI